MWWVMRLNKLSGLILLSCIISIVSCGVELSESEYISKAKLYIAEGSLDGAAIELKNVLRLNKDNKEARRLLGKIYFDKGNMLAAEKEFTEALSLGSDDELVLPILGQVFLNLGKIEALQGVPLSDLSTISKATLLAMQGVGELRQGKSEEARIKIDQAVGLSPDTAYVITARARLLASEDDGEFSSAREQLDIAFGLDPNYFEAWNILGDIERQVKNIDLAEQAYTKSLSGRDADVVGRIKRALTRIELKEYDSAQVDVDWLKKRIPGSASVNYVQGIISFYRDDFKASLDYFGLSKMDGSRYPSVLLYSAISHFVLGDLEQAESYANSYLSIYSDGIEARVLLAKIFIRRQRYEEAESIVRPAVSSYYENVVAMNSLSNALLRQGKTVEAITLLEKVVEINPSSVLARARLGGGLLVGREYSKGIKSLKIALELDPKNHRAHALLVLSYIKSNKIKLAIESAEDYKRNRADEVGSYNLLGRVYLAGLQQDEARGEFLSAVELVPGDPYASEQLAAMALREKLYEKARNYYLEILRYNENNLSALMKLAVLYAFEKNTEYKVKTLITAIESHPKSKQARLMLARHYLVQGKPDKAIFLIRELDERFRNSYEFLRVVALSYMSTNDFSSAILSLEKLVELSDATAQDYLNLAMAYSGVNDRIRMKRSLEKAVVLDPSDFLSRLAMTRFHLFMNNEVEFKSSLIALKKINANHIDVVELDVIAARQEGKETEALIILKETYEMFPTTKSMLMLARHYMMIGRGAESLALQESWANEYPNDVQSRVALAGMYEVQDNEGKLIDLYVDILDIDEDNSVVLNNLAWELRESDPERALGYAKRASILSPDSADVLDTLAVLFLINGEVQKAQDNIANALNKVPRDFGMRYHSAMIDVAAGDKRAALMTLVSLLEDGGDFPEKEEANKLLEKIQSEG